MKRILLICLLLSTTLAVAAGGARRRFQTESLDSTTVSIALRDGTKQVLIAPNSWHIRVYGYHAGVIVDSMRVKAGTYFVLPVHGLDSLRVERPGFTKVSWLKNPTYSEMAGGYMNAFSKACPYAHGDTLASGQTTMSYSVRAANADSDHPGKCNNFQSVMVAGLGGNDNNRLLLQVYNNAHLIAQFEVPNGEIFETTSWTFDSLKVTTVGPGTFTYASFSVSWNHGEF